MFGLELGPVSNVYRGLLVVHIMVAIIGFGAVALNGVYASQVNKRPGPEGRAVSEANYAVSNIAEGFILAVPISGLALVWASDSAWALGDLWIWASIALFAVALGISRGLLMPGHRQLNHLLGEINDAGASETTQHQGEIARIGKTMAASGAILNLLLVAIVVLMVWKPST